MDANEILESYVRDVADCLPRARRGDVASELRSLLAEIDDRREDRRDEQQGPGRGDDPDDGARHRG